MLYEVITDMPIVLAMPSTTIVATISLITSSSRPKRLTTWLWNSASWRQFPYWEKWYIERNGARNNFV